MEQFCIQGGNRLTGEVVVRGSKNAAPKLMVASLLTDEPCVIENIPLSGEMEITKELCESVGSDVRFDEHARVCRIATKTVATSRVPTLSRKNRIPILALGPLLHRNGIAEIPVLGGCPIGHRPVNFHMEALNKLGVRIERRGNSYYAEADHIYGADIIFPYPSVGATENVLLTAVCADGITIIQNAAVEPEILNLVEMLRGMGADIVCDTAVRRIEIRGVSNLHGVSIRTIPDRTEIVSLAIAALVTDGDIVVRNIEADHLSSFLQNITAAGASFEIQGSDIRFSGMRPYRPIRVATAPHPGFMTDWQQPFCVLLTQAAGESILHETVYEDRFGYVKDLNRMGANIVVSDDCVGGEPCRFSGYTYNHRAVIEGPTALTGVRMTMTDIRAGMAHIIAALVAEGESVISGIEHVDRGYEKIDERLRGLGADIKRVSNS